jgi:hypothetical protein
MGLFRLGVARNRDRACWVVLPRVWIYVMTLPRGCLLEAGPRERENCGAMSRYYCWNVNLPLYLWCFIFRGCSGVYVGLVIDIVVLELW